MSIILTLAVVKNPANDAKIKLCVALLIWTRQKYENSRWEMVFGRKKLHELTFVVHNVNVSYFMATLIKYYW